MKAYATVWAYSCVQVHSLAASRTVMNLLFDKWLAAMNAKGVNF